ncbi:AAA family ATPase [Bacillus sp. DNRA2]|uniref:ATP-binding protein n=1 Tax=Bacillus sp. DNRA2 TaxID=2723053 RepID=UPI0032B7EC23
MHIYGYGKLENFIVKDLDSFTIFYGENEAGKSTMMSFIHSILFGFPTKNQTELRYEPKRFSKFGGQLVVTFPSGKAVIERVKGKATGDVSVILEDGSRGGEELLQQLLSHIDKGLYQAIFSFNLHGLQHMQGLKNEDLGKFLFSTGALGTDRLLATENALQRELDTLYKPSGKKPFLNEKIAEIKQLHKELKQAEQAQDQYWGYLEEKELLENKINTFQLELANKQSRLVKLMEWRRILPLVIEADDLSKEALSTVDIEFPDGGIQKLDELQWRRITIHNKLNQLTTKIAELKLEIDQTKPQDDMLKSELDINTAVENLPLYEQLIQEEKQLNMQQNQKEQQIVEIQNTLHMKIEEEVVLKCNTSLFMKERTLQAQRVQLQLKEKKHQLDEQFYEAQKELEQIEDAKSKMNAKLLSEQERSELLVQTKHVEQHEIIKQELLSVQNQLNMLNRLAQTDSRQAKSNDQQQLIGKWIFMLLFFGLAIWSIFSGLWFVTALSVALLLYVFIFQGRKVKQATNQFETEIANLTEKQTALEAKLAKGRFPNSEVAKHQLELDNETREQLRILNIRWEQKNDQYEKVLNAYEKWEQDVRKSTISLEELGRELGIPKEIAHHFIHDAFLLIEKLKNVLIEREKLKSRQVFIAQELRRIEARFSTLIQKFIGSEPIPIHNGAYLLKQALKREQEKAILHQEKQLKHRELEAEIQLCQDEKIGLDQAFQHLFSLAKADNEADYRKNAQLHKRKQNVAVRLAEISRQLTDSGIDNEESLTSDFGVDADEVAQQINILKSEQATAQDEVLEIQKRLAEIKYQISLIEEGGTYAELLHLFKLKQAELNEESKTWAKYAIAKDILNNAVERYKNDRLPKLMERAQSYLQELTGQQYMKIHVQKDGSSFLIESYDHILFEPKELSQATSEQVYVALRLALATTLYEKYQFPIIIDDSFVNFDHQRTKKVVDLLCGLKDHQILFFTCHQHLLSHFQTGKLIKLGERDQSFIIK